MITTLETLSLYRKRMINWICALWKAEPNNRRFFLEHDFWVAVHAVSLFPLKVPHILCVEGDFYRLKNYVKRGDSTRVWQLTMVLIFSLKLQTPLAISMRNCETTYQRFYLYWTIKLTDFFTDLHGIHMRGKGVSKYQSLENKRNWNWVDSHYAWKKFAKLEISPYPNSFTGNQNDSLKETQFS